MGVKDDVLKWHHQLLNYGWIKILRPRARDLVHYCVAHAYKDCVPISVDKIYRELEFNKATLLEAVNELVAYEIVKRASQQATEKINEFLKERGAETGDVIVRLLRPFELSREDLWLLNDAKTRDAVLAIVSGHGVSQRMVKAIEQRKASIEKSPMTNDHLWSNVYDKLIALMKKRIEDSRSEVSLRKALAYLLPHDKKEREILERELYPERTAKATTEHWKSLNKFERDVALFYEKFTGNELKADEVELVKECVRLSYPVQLKWAIQKHADKIKDFAYLATLVRKGACGFRSDNNKKGGLSNERPIGKALEVTDWAERRNQYLKKRTSNGS